MHSVKRAESIGLNKHGITLAVGSFTTTSRFSVPSGKDRVKLSNVCALAHAIEKTRTANKMGFIGYGVTKNHQQQT